MQPCFLWSLSFHVIDDLATSDPALYAALFRLMAAYLCEDGERMKFRLSAMVDALYSKPLRTPVPRSTLRALAALP